VAVGVTSPGPAEVGRLTIRSRRILTRDGWLDGSVVVREGRIADLHPAGQPGSEPDVADVDATDLLILPGLVDSHAHVREPGFTHKEDWASCTEAALVGGVTTVVDMPNVDPPPNTVERFLAHREHAARAARTDFGHNVAGTIPSEIPRLAEAGATAFKVFMVRDARRTYPHMPGIAVDDPAELYRIAEAVADTGRLLMVHPHDTALADVLAERAIAEWGRGPLSYARSLRLADGLVMDSGIATMLAIQRATEVRLHILHASTPVGLAMIRAAKADGRQVTAEANPFHLLVVNDWATIERHGPYALGQWLPEAHATALWAAVHDGTIDVIGSDHTPHTREEKEPGWSDMFATPGGSPTIQHYLALLLTAAADGRISLERIVELCAEAPARLLGMAGRKGTIEIGSDADFIVVDPDADHVIREADVRSKCGWTILDGRAVRGRVSLAVRRGEVVMADGHVLARPGSGRFVPPHQHPGPTGPAPR
jgi:dihydroorotase (multifunctional complex type)